MDGDWEGLFDIDIDINECDIFSVSKIIIIILSLSNRCGNQSALIILIIITKYQMTWKGVSFIFISEWKKRGGWRVRAHELVKMNELVVFIRWPQIRKNETNVDGWQINYVHTFNEVYEWSPVTALILWYYILIVINEIETFMYGIDFSMFC